MSISKAHAFKILNQTMCPNVPQGSSGSATIAKHTLDVRRAPMMCTSLPSFSGATLWMLSGETTSESPSAREVAVFNARPCEQGEQDFNNSGVTGHSYAHCSASGQDGPQGAETELPILQLEN